MGEFYYPFSAAALAGLGVSSGGGNGSADSGKLPIFNASGYTFEPGYFMQDDFQTLASETPAGLPQKEARNRATWRTGSGWGGGSVRVIRRANGDCEVRGNINTAERVYVTHQAPLSPDYMVTGAFVLRSDDNKSAIGVGLRADHLCEIGYIASYNTDGNVWELREIATTTTTVLGTYAQTLTVDVEYLARIVANGSTISVQVYNGTTWDTRITVTDTTASRDGLPFLWVKNDSTDTTGIHLRAIYGQDNNSVVPYTNDFGITWFGDSNSTDYQYLGARTGPEWCATTLNCRLRNDSQANRQLTGYLASIATIIPEDIVELGPFSGKKVLVLQLGTNDLAVGRTSAQLLADVVSCISTARSNGIDYALVCNIPAASSISGGAETQRTAYNSALTTASSGADAIVPLATILPANTNTRYWNADSLHYTPLGWQLVGVSIANAIAGIAKTAYLSYSRVTSTATAAGTTVLTPVSAPVQIFTGSTTQSVTLPLANSVSAGRTLNFTIKNRSSGSVTVNRAGSDTIDGGTSTVIASNASITLVSNGSNEWVIT